MIHLKMRNFYGVFLNSANLRTYLAVIVKPFNY